MAFAKSHVALAVTAVSPKDYLEFGSRVQIASYGQLFQVMDADSANRHQYVARVESCGARGATFKLAQQDEAVSGTRLKILKSHLSLVAEPALQTRSNFFIERGIPGRKRMAAAEA